VGYGSAFTTKVKSTVEDKLIAQTATPAERKGVVREETL